MSNIYKLHTANPRQTDTSFLIDTTLPSVVQTDKTDHRYLVPSANVPHTKESGEENDNKEMTESEQYYQKAIDGAFRALDIHIKSMDGHLGQLRWVMGIGVALISILVTGLYFSVNSGFSSLRNEMNAQAESVRTEIREMDKRWEQRQVYYEKYLDAKTSNSTSSPTKK